MVHIKSHPLGYGKLDLIAYYLSSSIVVIDAKCKSYADSWIAMIMINGLMLSGMKCIPRIKIKQGLLWRNLIMINYLVLFMKKKGVHSTNFVKYKATLVTQGFSQKKGVDYNEVFFRVIQFTSIKILLSKVVYHDMH